MLLISSKGLPSQEGVPMTVGDRIVSLSMDGEEVLINTGQNIYRLSGNNSLTRDMDGRHALSDGEVIQAVAAMAETFIC